MRVDKFLIEDIRFNRGRVKLGFTEHESSRCKIKPSDIIKLNSVDDNENILNLKENWRNKVPKETEIDDSLEINAMNDCNDDQMDIACTDNNKCSMGSMDVISDQLEVIQQCPTQIFHESEERSLEKLILDADIYLENTDDKNLLCKAIENQIGSNNIENNIQTGILDKIEENDNPVMTKLSKYMNAKATVRGKYLRPCPDIVIKHKRLQTAIKTGKKVPERSNNASKSIIRNGNCLCPIKMFKKTVMLNNTCAFDSLIEIFQHACDNVVEFEDFVHEAAQNKINAMLSIVSLYVKNGIKSTVYQQRAYALYANFYKEKETIAAEESVVSIDCTTNVARILELFMKDVPSVTEKMNCVRGHEYSIERHTLTVKTQ